MIAFEHEMDNTDMHSADGPDADYVAAYRRVVDLFREAGRDAYVNQPHE
ncbi:hypothetical protein [Sorangium sp. So ce362]